MRHEARHPHLHLPLQMTVTWLSSSWFRLWTGVPMLHTIPRRHPRMHHESLLQHPILQMWKLRPALYIWEWAALCQSGEGPFGTDRFPTPFIDWLMATGFQSQAVFRASGILHSVTNRMLPYSLRPLAREATPQLTVVTTDGGPVQAEFRVFRSWYLQCLRDTPPYLTAGTQLRNSICWARGRTSTIPATK